MLEGELGHARYSVTAGTAEAFLRALKFIAGAMAFDEPSVGAALTSVRVLRQNLEEHRARLAKRQPGNGTP